MRFPHAENGRHYHKEEPADPVADWDQATAC